MACIYQSIPIIMDMTLSDWCNKGMCPKHNSHIIIPPVRDIHLPDICHCHTYTDACDNLSTLQSHTCWLVCCVSRQHSPNELWTYNTYSTNCTLPLVKNGKIGNTACLSMCTLTFKWLVWPWPLRYESRSKSLHIVSMRTTSVPS